MLNAVITGSASGIGAATAALLRAEGMRVIGVDVQSAEVQADLSAAQGRAAAAANAAALCEGRIDRLVLCAGIGGHGADLARVASVNYFGAVEMLDALQPALARGTAPAAVAVCSNSARYADFAAHPYVQACLAGDENRARELAAAENGFVAYAGGKYALACALRRRAKAWGEAGIRLNGIAPGPVQTPLLQGTLERPDYRRGFEALDIPLKRVAAPEEIAALIGVLLGPLAAYMHGSIVMADGGNDAAMFPDRI